jgi:parallel beta-helix repeat protein
MNTLRLALLIALLHNGMAAAASLYVSPTGSDSVSRAGNTLSTPWRTIQKAATTAQPGDVVYVRAGTYAEFINVGVSGTASQPIILRNYPEERVIIDPVDALISSSNESVILIQNRSHIIIQGLIIQGLAFAGTNITPTGIHVRSQGGGSSTGVQLRGNIIRRIYQNSTDSGSNRFSYNAHGIKVFGRNANGVTALVIDGNEVTDLRLGASEALVVNGNVSNFRITRNRVHHCNNIGIDIIGYEGVGPVGQDRARNGVIADNLVYEIDSSLNPAYRGDFVNGGGEKSAAGIYIDGGTDCIIERNHVHHCNFGIELASEADNTDYPTASADFITLRNNIIRHNDSNGLIMGGYNASRGAAENNSISNNTFYENGQDSTSTPQVLFQNYVRNNSFRNNLFVTRSSQRVMIGSSASLGTGNTFAYSLYYVPTGQSPTFGGVTSVGPTDSIGNPQFSELVPTQTSPGTAYQLRSSSPARDTGDPSFSPAAGERDYYHGSRINGGRVDRGADEF